MTACSVHDFVFLNPSSDYSCTDRDVRDQMEGIWKIFDECSDFEVGYHEKIVYLHLATEIIYHLERETDAGKDPSGSSDSPSRNDLDGGEDPSGSSPQKNRKVSKFLSGYMMYLLIMQSLLLPNEDKEDTLIFHATSDMKSGFAAN
ncbi:hypothetical protein RHSIM_Rhsim01G0023100 [Rhododendron simsii]|uniref:Uncharacterized protein n=1 Tax=Rhododendron simsii TaxID=118357 RepID=A0A834HGG2_RHOSS|nr:hypothetical protein RHSIM_Rhsim01G0023100 [Rhododendron simsii]